MSIKSKYIGDSQFYKKTLSVAVPIMIQNGITNFVGLLDNIMVGRVGTEQMSGIAIVNQLLIVFNLAIFGAISGAGIFTAQYYGAGDDEGVRNTFRFKMYICIGITALGILALSFFGENLIRLYLHGEGNGLSVEDALVYGKKYLRIMLIGMIPFAIEQSYSGTLRECGETSVSMKAGIAAVAVNLGLNYVLIFGKFGFPALGVEGAAIATVISRYVQAAIVIIWTHTHKEKMPFIKGAYRKPAVPAALTKQIVMRGAPLMLNEVLWAAGIAALNQCYSMRGLDAVAAINISSTITNLFNVVFIAFGDAIAIVVGQLLGAERYDEAKDTDRKLITFSVLLCVGIGALLALLAPLFPKLYKTNDGVRQLAGQVMRISAAFMPAYAFMHAAYFTLRSGGKTIVTFLFDSVFLWVISVPVAFVISRYTGVPLLLLFFSIQALDLIKCAVGFVLVKKGVWINKIVRT